MLEQFRTVCLKTFAELDIGLGDELSQQRLAIDQTLVRAIQRR